MLQVTVFTEGACSRCAHRPLFLLLKLVSPCVTDLLRSPQPFEITARKRVEENET